VPNAFSWRGFLSEEKAGFRIKRRSPRFGSESLCRKEWENCVSLALAASRAHIPDRQPGRRHVLQGRRILLIVAGGIAAYKCLELIRRLREQGAAVRVVMTKAAQEFVTPLSLASLSEDKVYSELWSLTDESEMGHIRLSREADLVVVAPATADLIARMAAGLADDLAATALLASDKPVLIAPAMNAMMWAHPATQANLATLKARGVLQVGPGAGELACGEVGFGRMAEPADILAAITRFLTPDRRLAGRRALVTSGPTREPIDPVRYLSNHSSGKQDMRSPPRWRRSAPRRCWYRARARSRPRRGCGWSRSRPRGRCWRQASRPCPSMSR
jgi:3-polyprenyl-4-hydroxybenzoate decarboxylase